MPSRGSVYDSTELGDAFPATSSPSIGQHRDRRAAPKSAFYSQISSAVQSVWHSPDQRQRQHPGQVRAPSSSDVLTGRRLL